jgi:hypothetical protein
MADASFRGEGLSIKLLLSRLRPLALLMGIAKGNMAIFTEPHSGMSNLFLDNELLRHPERYIDGQQQNNLISIDLNWNGCDKFIQTLISTHLYPTSQKTHPSKTKKTL